MKIDKATMTEITEIREGLKELHEGMRRHDSVIGLIDSMGPYLEALESGICTISELENTRDDHDEEDESCRWDQVFQAHDVIWAASLGIRSAMAAHQLALRVDRLLEPVKEKEAANVA